MADITEDQYLKALQIVEKYDLAKKAIEQYEAQQRFESDPTAEIMEAGKVEFVEGEIIRDNPLLWRATKLRYVHEKGTVERIVSYSSEPIAKDLLSVKSDKSIIL